MTIRVGDIVVLDGETFRIIYIDSKDAVLCQMNISSMNLVEVDFKQFVSSIQSGEIQYIVDDDMSVIEESEDVYDKGRISLRVKLQVAEEIQAAFGPKYLDLLGYAHKVDLDTIIEKYEISRASFWRICRRYLQSGMRSVSQQRKKRAIPDNVSYTKKTGAPGKYGIAAGCIVDEKVVTAFNAGLRYYKSGRAKTYASAFDMINSEFFSTGSIENGVYKKNLLPENQRPTFRQFHYFCSKNVTESEKDIIKTSRIEARNNKRLLLGEASDRTEYPGEKVECDAVEFDISLVSMVDPTQTVGRPIMYVMRDVLTHAIVAFSVGFDNNSNIGLTNLLLNLGDDKNTFCEKYGMVLDDPRLWPSNFIPQELYADRGSDFKSDPFGRVCKELGITRHLVSGGSGSLKGTVESWFHQMHTMINPHTEDIGLIEKRYDSKHHREATLNIFDFTKLAITCVLSYNQTHMDGYMPRLEEIQNNIDAVPSLLWEYYCSAKGAPRPIADRASYLMKLLIPAQAKVSRRGIEHKGIIYLNRGDKVLLKKMYHQQNKKSPIEIRYDPRDNTRIFYVDSTSHLNTAGINRQIGWMDDIAGMTWADSEEYIKLTKHKNRDAVQHNAEIRAARFGVAESIVQEAKQRQPLYSNTSNLRKAREEEKQLVSRANAITDRLKPPALASVESNDSIERKSIDRKETKSISEKEYLDLVANFDEMNEK